MTGILGYVITAFVSANFGFLVSSVLNAGKIADLEGALERANERIDELARTVSEMTRSRAVALSPG